jgi:hypothetical protein
MGIIETFVSFAEGLTGQRRKAFEAELAALMETYSDRFEFTPEELAELDRRVAEPKPDYATADEVERILGWRPPE